MALAVNGSGTIFKKCDRSNHRPDSNQGCASSTCQHTCDTPERCQHAWTLRYWVSGKKLARDRQLKRVTIQVQDTHLEAESGMKPHPKLARMLRALNRASYMSSGADEATAGRLAGELRLPEPPDAGRGRPVRHNAGRRYRGRPLPPPG